MYIYIHRNLYNRLVMITINYISRLCLLYNLELHKKAYTIHKVIFTSVLLTT